MSEDCSIIDFGDSNMNRMMRDYIKHLKGLYWCELRRCKEQRSDPQNKNFHGVILPLVMKQVSELWGDECDFEQAKSLLKAECLKRPLIDKDTGETLGHYIGRTRDLNTAEFAEFVDRVIVFCAEKLGLEIPPPSSEYERNFKVA